MIIFFDKKGVVYSDRTDYSQKSQNYVNYTTPTDNKNDCKVLCDKQQFSSMYGICLDEYQHNVPKLTQKQEAIFAAIAEDLKTKLTESD